MRTADLALAAAIADPMSRDPGCKALAAALPEQAGAVVGILRRNKVPLVGLPAGGIPEAIAGTPEWRDAIAAESEEKAALLAEYAGVASRLESEGIVPVLFKSPGGVPYRSSNLDVLVAPQEMATAARLLERDGHLRLTNYREPRKILYRRFRGGRSVISVHLHEAVSWGHVLILAGEDVSARSRVSPEGECRVASREDLVIATLAHILYETDQVRLADLRGIRMSVASPGFDWDAVTDRVAARGWARGLAAIVSIVVAVELSLYGDSLVPAAIRRQALDSVAARRWSRIYPSAVRRRLEAAPPAEMPLPLSRVHSKIHFLARLCGEEDRSPDERIADVIATAANLAANRLRLRCRPAALVSLSGLDGSGKSRVARAVADALDLCEIPTRTVWSRGGFSGWMEALKRTARTTMSGSLPGADDLQGKRLWLSGRMSGAAFCALVAIEQAVRLLLHVRVPRWLGTSIVCDRFAWDTAADLETKLGPGHPASRIAGNLLIAAAPRPHPAILLRVDPAVAALRKPGEAHRHRLEEQSRALDRLAASCNLTVIDATRPEPEVLDEAVNLVLSGVLSGFAGRPEKAP